MILLLSCVAQPECEAGWTEQADGTCWREVVTPWSGPAEVSDLLDALPACTFALPSDRLDLWGACADGICVGDTYDTVTAAFGEPTCTSDEVFGYGYLVSWCAWPNGLEAWIDDKDEDGAPDGDAPLGSLYLRAPYSGTTEEGLGRGVGFSCFVDVYGDPDWLGVSHDGTEWRISSLSFSFAEVGVSWSETEYAWDGTVGTVRAY
jgi:hypothetical protein